MALEVVASVCFALDLHELSELPVFGEELGKSSRLLSFKFAKGESGISLGVAFTGEN
jgi:hypothetical protein